MTPEQPLRADSAVRPSALAQQALDQLTREQVELLTLMDRTSAFRAISDRVRSRLGADFAMVGTFSGETMQLRHLSGHRTPTLDGLLVPDGAGLGGRVLAEGGPAWVSDYISNPTITHDFDEPVAAEELKAMLAAPVLVGGEVVGVLYASMRHQGLFGDQAIDELMTLAQETARAMDVFGRVEAHTDAAITAERQRASVALHDSVGAILFGIGAQVRNLQADRDVPAHLSDRLTSIEDQVSAAASALRESLRALAPSEEDGELAAGAIGACDRFSRRTGIDARAVVLGTLPELDTARQELLLRVVHEGLLNVEKHSGASSVTVSLSAAGPGVGVAVADDGNGLGASTCPEPFSSGIGLQGLRLRVTENAGRLDVVEDDEGGVTLRAWIPCL